MSTRQELSDFRIRLRNWARVYRDRLKRGESNLMWVIRALERAAAVQEERKPDPDFRDADLIDSYVVKLRAKSKAFSRVFKVLKVEYLTRYSVEDFETVEDQRRADRTRANAAGVFYSDYDEKLMMAETLLMNFVKTIEQKPENCAIVPSVL